VQKRPEVSSKEADDRPRKSSRTVLWVSSTYFAEGLPYMIVRILSGIYFTDIGAKERYIGYLNFLGFPWNFKFVWAPFVDALSTKRRWMIAVQLLVTLLTALVAATCAFTPSEGDISRVLVLTAVVFVGMAFVSATNDIVIDGYYLEALPDKGDQAAYSGYRVMAYRLAVIFARSGLVEVAAIAGRTVGGENKHLAWAWAFGAAAGTMLLLTAFHALWLPKAGVAAEKKSPKEMLRTYGRAFVSYLDQEKVALVLVFIVFYKMGDEILFSMVTPFMMREIGLTKDQYAWIGGFVGAGGAIAGAMLGGWWIKKWGLKRAIWPLTLLMNFNIWAYCWLAWAKPDPKTLSGVWTVAVVHGYEQLAAGLGSASLLVYLLRTCKPEFKAAHYAIGSAIMSLGSTIVGGFGGRVVESIGYLNLFILSFFASLPSMILLLFVPLGEVAPVTPRRES
jgi:MFS transporter, PAT family, beta-lactamase induction signal transducer AmpG